MRVHEECAINVLMRVLGNDTPLLLWRAERPFQIQLLAALGRLGADVSALSAPEGKALVDQIHPKNYVALEVPMEFEGSLIWAPDTELFSNSKLSAKSLKELNEIAEIVKSDSRIKEGYLVLPHAAHSQVKFDTKKLRILYVPTLVGFGDKNIFDKLFDQIQNTGIAGRSIDGELLSLFDAISLCISYLKLEKAPHEVWATGHSISTEALELGFEEVEDSFLGPLKYIASKLLKKDARFLHQNTSKPENIEVTMEIFPTVLSPWERFFRDSYRIYQATPDSALLLHFRPTKTP